MINEIICKKWPLGLLCVSGRADLRNERWVISCAKLLRLAVLVCLEDAPF
ncbi:hypothetical protein RvY_03515, partial [Ramazzottius varieornatus]